MTFDQVGTLYNQITNELVGGVTHANQQTLIRQVSTVQNQIQGLIDNGSFNSFADPVNGNVTVVHAQNIADQMNFLKAQISNFGTNSFTPKFINDVVRDVQDIVAGDQNLTNLAQQNNHAGFQQVSNLLTPPTPFPDSGAQTNTLLQFISDSNSLASRAQALAGSNSNSAAVQTLINDIHTFSTNADAYSTAQGGLFSARFNNEFTLNGVQGTASNELIAGLQTGNASLVNGAASVLTANAMDVRSNMLVTGQTFAPAANGGIPATINDVNTAGIVFNDAATKLIGGVYSGNQASIVNDLNAVQTGLKNAITSQAITGNALQDVNHVNTLVAQESALVSGINTANPTQVSRVNAQINHDQTQILNIINNDPTLAGLAAGNNGGTAGFAALPPTHAIHNAAAMANAAPAANAPAPAIAATPAANAPAAASAATPVANAPAAANPAPAVGDNLAAMVDAAMANLTSPPAAMAAAAAGANIPAAANPAPAALSPPPAAADHAAIDTAHHSFLDNHHISTAHDQLHHLWG